MERMNSISGRLYRDDATIFAWDLVNEPRCETWRVCSLNYVCAWHLLGNFGILTHRPGRWTERLASMLMQRTFVSSPPTCLIIILKCQERCLQCQAHIHVSRLVCS